MEQSNQLVLLARLGEMADWSVVLQARGGIASPVVSGDQRGHPYLIEEERRWRKYLPRHATSHRVEVAVCAGKPRQIFFSEGSCSLMEICGPGSAGTTSREKVWASPDIC